MYNYHKLFRLSIISIILIILTMSCNFISAFTGSTPESKLATLTPETPTPTIQTVENSGNQIIFTEADVTSWINEISAQNPEIKLVNPKVVIQDGLCSITGDIEPASNNSNPLYSSLSGKMEVQFTINQDENKNPVVEIKALKLNNSDMPAFVTDQFSSMINSSITSSLSSELNGHIINQIIISNGKITIVIN